MFRLKLSIFFIIGVCFNTFAIDYSYLDPDELRKITFNGKDIPVLVKPWLGKNKFGNVLLIPDFKIEPDQAGFVSSIRRSLPLKGWTTFEVSPPDSNDSQEIQEKYLVEVIRHIEVLEREYNGLNVWGMQGKTALLIVPMIAKKVIKAPDALIIIDAYGEDKQSNYNLIQSLKNIQPSTLDVITSDANGAAIFWGKKRSLNLYEGLPEKYQQITITNINHNELWNEGNNIIESFSRRILQKNLKECYLSGPIDFSKHPARDNCLQLQKIGSYTNIESTADKDMGDKEVQKTDNALPVKDAITPIEKDIPIPTSAAKPAMSDKVLEPQVPTSAAKPAMSDKAMTEKK